MELSNHYYVKIPKYGHTEHGTRLVRGRYRANSAKFFDHYDKFVFFDRIVEVLLFLFPAG